MKGNICLSGDKSISHRALMIASLINDQSEIYNLSNADDVLTTIECLKECRIAVKMLKNNCIAIKGGSLASPLKILDCRNSGSTARMMLGLLAGQGIDASFTGDSSLLNRPMKRIIDPLNRMGLKIKSNNMMLPISISKSKLNPLDYKINTKSAQVKSSLILAGLGCEDYSKISFNSATRDHTEKLLKFLNFNIDINNRIKIKKTSITSGFKLTVPGDISSASFLIAAAVLLPKSHIIIRNVLYNKTRLGFVDVLKRMNANISITNINKTNFEWTCTINARYSPDLNSINISERDTIRMIDEIPILSVVATQCRGKTIIKGVQELRYKESNRLHLICKNLTLMGAHINCINNSIIIDGGNKLHNTTIDHGGDHRIAMSFEVLNLIINKSLSNKYSKIIGISFPDFYNIFRNIIK